MHDCIHCDHFEMIALAEGQLPQVSRHVCPSCGTVQWIKHSRVDPCTYSEDEVEVDEETRTFRIKGEK
jgi:hypothetical protein